MPDAVPLEPGDPASLGRYEVVGRLGVGGQGAVFLGRTRTGERRAGGAPEYEYCAIKLLHAQMVADSAARARFAREVSAAQRVAHFCTARVLEYDVHGDQPYIVSEYINGPSLHEVVMRDGPRGAVELERLAIGTVTALAAIHESGIVHRDFKPNNVLLADDGPRVVDFGIARHFDTQESAVTATGMVVGTPGYLAPEQLTGHQLGPAVDIFALGTTMVFAATGRSPFDADSLPVIINRILNEHPDLTALPGSLRVLVERCLRKAPAERPSAIQLLQELLGQVGAAPARDEALQEGTRIAAEMPAQGLSQQPPGQPLSASGPAAAAAAAAASSPAGFPATPPPMSAAPPITPLPTTPPPTTPPPMSAPPPSTPPMPAPPIGYGPSTPPPMGYGPSTPPPAPMSMPTPMAQGPRTPPPMRMGPPTQTPPPGYPPRRRGPSGTRGPVLAAVGCSVVFFLIVVIVIVVAAVSSNSNDPDDDYDSAPTRAASPSPSATGVTADFDGTWKGTGYQTRPERTHWEVELRLVEGLGIGSVRYPECSGIVRVVSSTPDELVMRQTITSGTQYCEPSGYVTLSTPGSTRVRFEYSDDENAVTPNATGTLYKD